MKKIIILTLALILSISFFGCQKREVINYEEIVKGNIYVYEKEGFGGNFTIKIFEDGTFEFYEGPLSSYIGTGKWSVTNNILTLITIDDKFTNNFEIKDDELTIIFKEENSTNFPYIVAKEGDEFIGRDLNIVLPQA